MTTINRHHTVRHPRRLWAARLTLTTRWVRYRVLMGLVHALREWDRRETTHLLAEEDRLFPTGREWQPAPKWLWKLHYFDWADFWVGAYKFTAGLAVGVVLYAFLWLVMSL